MHKPHAAQIQAARVDWIIFKTFPQLQHLKGHKYAYDNSFKKYRHLQKQGNA